MIQGTPLWPPVTHPPRLTARRHTTKSTAAARRHRARRHRAALVDEAGTRGRSSERAAVERSTASRRHVPRPRQEEKQHACEPLDPTASPTARAPSDDVFRNAWMQDSFRLLISAYFRFMELAGTGSSQANLTAEPAEAVYSRSKQSRAMGWALPFFSN